MCGIFGYVGNGLLDELKVRSSLKKLSHRGPDSSKVLTLGKVSLGFARLAIQDLSSRGDQPMSLVDDGIHIVFNGEIYNFQELRKDLESSGEVFKSGTDTEVILRGYLRWGIDKLLQKLDGMMAFGLYDEKKNFFYLARDRTGMKPLFFTHYDKGIVFSSEVKAILEFTGIRELDMVNSYNPIFMTGLSPTGKTMFKGVEQVPTGHLLRFDLEKNEIQTSEFFHLSHLIDPAFYGELSKLSKASLIDLYTLELRKSVELHLLSDAPLGSLFSAGLDSSVISALACQIAKVPLNLYYFQSNSQDDLKYPNEFVKKFGGNLISAIGKDENYISMLPRMIYHYETINKEEGPVLGNLCSLARKDGFKVLLTGDAADEVFGGQSFHSSFLTQSRYFYSRFYNKLKRELNTKAANSFFSYEGSNPIGTHYFSFPPGPGFSEVPMNYFLYNGTRLKDWKRCLKAYDFIQDPVERNIKAYTLDEVSYRLERFMIRSDRFGMMESMEIRTPFLHPNILKLAVNTPFRHFIHEKGLFGLNLERKHLLREIAKKIGVPEEVIYRKKIGTPFNNTGNVIKVIEKLGLHRLADHLKIPENDLREMALDSFNPNQARTQFSFLASEVLIKLFIDQVSVESLTEDFKKVFK